MLADALGAVPGLEGFIGRDCLAKNQEICGKESVSRMSHNHLQRFRQVTFIESFLGATCSALRKKRSALGESHHTGRRRMDHNELPERSRHVKSFTLNTKAL